MKIKKWKSRVAMALCVAMTGILVGCGATGEEESSVDMSEAGGKNTIVVLNYGEYIDTSVLKQFQKETGIKVLYEEATTPEEMYSKYKASTIPYDLICSSDYMVERLIEEGETEEIDFSQMQYIDNIGDLYWEMSKSYDPELKYSIPYFWGTVGIVYDKTKVEIRDLEAEGFGIFLDEKYKGDVYLYDSERDAFMMALKDLGYSMNTTSEKEIQEAYDWLVQCVETMDAEIVTDEIIDNMAQGRKALGLIYSGDATYVMEENENMGYYMPDTGTNLWSDAMVIPKNAKNPELAHAFINYASDYDGAYDNSSYVGYTSANQEVMDDIYGEGGDYEGIEAYIPRIDNPNDEVFVYNEDTKKIMGDLWSRVKIAASNAD